MARHPCVEATIVTVFVTIAYAIMRYALNLSINLTDAVIFAAAFGVVFYFGQKYFSKRIKKKK